MSNTNAETIRDFLISLGFEIDNANEKKFSAMVAGVTGNVLKLGAAVEGAALAVVGFTAQVASGLDKLYWQAQRTGGAVEQIKSLGYAVSQSGGSVEGLNSSLEGVAKFLRSNPGGEGFLRNMGIQTRDTNGQLRDTASLVALVGERLSGMPTYRANQYASILGIDENTLMAMRRGIGGYAADYHRIIKTLGYNPEVAAKHANAFMTQMYQLKLVTGSAKDKIGGELARVLTPSVEKFTNLILKHWPTIEKVIMSVVKAVLTLSEILGQMVYRGAQGIRDLIGWWKRLDEGSQNLIKIFGLVAAAWWALNAGFLTSPIGIITALLAAMFLLYDDYQGWKERKNSFIDWGKWEGTIQSVMKALKEMGEWVGSIVKSIGGWETVFWGFALFLGGKWLTSVLGTLGKLSTAVGKSGLTKLLRTAGLLAYAEYLYSDWDNITASAQASWNANTRGLQRAVGDVGQALGIENQWANQHKGYRFTETTIDIPTGDPYLDQLRLKVARGEKTLDEVNKILDEQFAPKKSQNNAGGKALLNSMSNTFTSLEQRYGLPAGLLHGVAMTESAGNPKAIGPETKYGTAKGMFQFVDSTAKGYGLTGNDVFDPHKSAEAAAKMLSSLLKTHGGDLDKALASYNWGIGNVQKLGMDRMPAETRNYIPKVRNNMVSRTALAKNSGWNFDPKMFDNAEKNINKMLSYTGHSPELLKTLASTTQNQTTIAPNYNITVNGVESPHEAAALTGETVQRNNAILVRSLQTKVH